MIRKYITPFGIILLVSIGISSVYAQTTLYVKEKAGAQTAFPLTAIRKITFSGDSMTVTKSSAETQVNAISGLRFLSFTDYFAGIPEPGGAWNKAPRLYPNPTFGMLQIEYPVEQNVNQKVEILDLQGRVMKNGSLQNGKTSLDVSGLIPGLYLCRIQSSTSVVTSKFIKN
jgi:hypothetical protein